MGAKYLSRNVSALATSGRLVIIGMQGGTRGELDIAALLRKRGAVIATSLRARPAGEKATIVAAVREHVWPLIAAGRVRPIVQSRHPARGGRGRAPRARGERPRRQDPAHHRLSAGRARPPWRTLAAGDP